MPNVGSIRMWLLTFLVATWPLALAPAVLAAGAPVSAAAAEQAPQPATAAGPVSSGSGIQQLFGDVVVPTGATLQGDVQVVAGNLNVQGTLAGSASMAAGQVTVGPGGVIAGDVSLGFGQVTVAPGGSIAGSVSVEGAHAAGLSCPPVGQTCTLQGMQGHPGSRRVQTAGIGSAPAWLFAHRGGWFGKGFAPWWAWLRVGFHVLGWLGTLALALPVAALWPGALGRVSGQIQRDPGRTALVGLGALVLAVPVLVLVAITIIGIPVAFAAVLGLAAAWFFGYVAAVALIGDRTLALARPGGAGLLWSIVAGSVLVAVAEWVPIIGGLVWLAVACLGLGAVLLTRFGSGGPWLQGGGAHDAGNTPTPL